MKMGFGLALIGWSLLIAAGRSIYLIGTGAAAQQTAFDGLLLLILVMAGCGIMLTASEAHTAGEADSE